MLAFRKVPTMKNFGTIRRHGLLLMLALATVAGPATAQDWPSKPVHILIPYAAGGNSDSMARLSAQRLTEALSQTFVIENKLGANGAIAADTVARSAPDGYTLLWGVQPAMIVSPAINKVNFDTQK